MKLKLHHINLSTNNVSGMDHFYRNVLGLKAETDGLPVQQKELLGEILASFPFSARRHSKYMTGSYYLGQSYFV
jgi:catechol 2,3-dioxygenase-like lactoylglutathione lyase family enzyme